MTSLHGHQKRQLGPQPQPLPDHDPIDVDDLAAAANGEVEAIPATRTLTQVVVAAAVAVVVVVVLLLVSVQWIRSAADDAAIGTECTGSSCVEVALEELSIAERLPEGTTVIASNRYSRLFEQFVYFEVRMPAGASLPELAEPWVDVESGDEPSSNAQRMVGRGYSDVRWSGEYAAGTDDDGSIIVVGTYLTG